MKANERRAFGNTGLSVSALGFGAGHIGGDDLSEADAERLLHGVLDAGVTLVDTARGYGRSEERLGRHLAKRRGEFVLVTKGGYGLAEHADWTAGCITAGVDAALRTLRTDAIDVSRVVRPSFRRQATGTPDRGGFYPVDSRVRRISL